MEENKAGDRNQKHEGEEGLNFEISHRGRSSGSDLKSRGNKACGYLVWGRASQAEGTVNAKAQQLENT